MQKERMERSDRGAAELQGKLRQKKDRGEDRLERTQIKLSAVMCVHI